MAQVRVLSQCRRTARGRDNEAPAMRHETGTRHRDRLKKRVLNRHDVRLELPEHTLKLIDATQSGDPRSRTAPRFWRQRHVRSAVLPRL
jgi:hypothetical protein